MLANGITTVLQVLAEGIAPVLPVPRRPAVSGPVKRQRPRRVSAPGALAPDPDQAAPTLLQLIWLASPALPIGGFSYSEGLESAVEQAWVSTEDEAREWLVDQLHLTLARAELPAIALAIDAWRRGDSARVNQLNAWVLQTRESSELRQQSEQMGRSLLDWLQSVQTPADCGAATGLWQAPAHDRDTGALSYPIAFARVAALTRAPVRDCLQCFAFGWAENMAQAAVRAVPLGQGAGQRILGRLAREIEVAVVHALQLTDDQRQAFSPRLAILSAQHEAQYSRLFRS